MTDYDRLMTTKETASERATLFAAAAFFHGLVDPTRLSILQLLMTGERKVVDVTENLGLAQSTVLQHLACVREGALVSVRSVGRSSVYSIASPEVIDTLQPAEKLLAVTGDAVVLCKNYGAQVAQ